jgi:two-component system phosphate regulon response regulator PhoB
MDTRILIVGDDTSLTTTLSLSLQLEGYELETIHSGRETPSRIFQTPSPHLVVLDLLHAGQTGLELCQRIRAHGATTHLPVMMLSSNNDEKARIAGFEAGTDDYVVKPFNLREFKLRVRAILRRSNAQSPVENPVLLVGELRLDTSAHRAWVDETELDLTALEFKLLATLMERQGRVQSRQQLLQDVWQYNAGVTTRTVDTHVRRLRSKLLTARERVETVRGVGYRFQAQAIH